jgi:hypothetical protein
MSVPSPQNQLGTILIIVDHCAMLARTRFCYSPVNQMKKYYREGTYDDCEAHRCLLIVKIANFIANMSILRLAY